MITIAAGAGVAAPAAAPPGAPLAPALPPEPDANTSVAGEEDPGAALDPTIDDAASIGAGAARRSVAPLVVVAACLLAACGRDEARQSTGAATPATGVQTGQGGKSEEVGQGDRDANITADVKARLTGDSALSAFDIQVQTSEGRVLLRGITPDSDARRHAAELARSVAGVVEVRNDLSVQLTQP